MLIAFTGSRVASARKRQKSLPRVPIELFLSGALESFVNGLDEIFFKLFLELE